MTVSPQNSYLLFLKTAFQHYTQNNNTSGWKSYRCGFKKIVLRDMILPGLFLNNFDWSIINLIGGYFTGSTMQHVNMDAIQSVGTNLSFSKFEHCTAINSEFYRAVMHSVLVKDGIFKQSGFIHSYITDSIFQDTELTGADFSFSRLERVEFRGCSLDKANFTQAVCQSVTFKNCSLKDTSFKVPLIPKHSQIQPLLKFNGADSPLYNASMVSELFNLSPDQLNMQTINKRFRELVKQFHPDRYHQASAAEKNAAQENFLRIKEAYLHLCESLNQRRDFPQNYELTVENLRMILNQDSDNDIAWYNLGFIYFRSMQYDESIQCYEKALKINPDNTVASHNLKVTRLVKTVYKSVSSRI